MSDNSQSSGKCPFPHSTGIGGGGTQTNDWWPNRLKLNILRQNSSLSNPMDDGFDYKEALEYLDFEELKKDLTAIMTDSKDWWPADFGHYGPFFVRMSWHAAGTYRTSDGSRWCKRRIPRFAPLNSWPREPRQSTQTCLVPKYGNKISWGRFARSRRKCGA